LLSPPRPQPRQLAVVVVEHGENRAFPGLGPADDNLVAQARLRAEVGLQGDQGPLAQAARQGVDGPGDVGGLVGVLVGVALAPADGEAAFVIDTVRQREPDGVRSERPRPVRRLDGVDRAAPPYPSIEKSRNA